MIITDKIKEQINEYYSFGDQTRIRRYGIHKGKKFSLVTINKAFRTGKCSDELLDLIIEFYLYKKEKYGK
jgi:hypothetical protein